MSKKIGFKLIFAFSLLVSAFSITHAQNLQIDYKEYIVIKGDTLWDISSKEFEEQDPFLWPKIWKENTYVKNPDLIYPGQTLKIPLRFLKKELIEQAPAEKTEEALDIPESALEPVPVQKGLPAVEPPKKAAPPKMIAKKIEPAAMRYIADKDLILSSGYITDYIADKVKSIGKITGAPTGRTIFGKNDYVYIKPDCPVNTGDKFYVIRAVQTVKHPKTNSKLGILIAVLGVAEVIGTEDGEIKAKITKSYNEISENDLLDTYYDVEAVMEEPIPRKPDVSGVVVAIHQTRTIVGRFDILFIDKGSNHGLEVGDMLGTVSFDKHAKSRTVGRVQLINVKNSTAVAVVRKSESVITVGDEIEGIK